MNATTVLSMQAATGWNYRRQSMMLDADRIGQLNAGPDFWAAVDANKHLPFYPPADFSREL